MVGKIDPRYGAEVYVSEGWKICIKQDQGTGQDLTLIFEDGEVDELIALLNEAKQELAEDRRVAAENDEN